MLIPKTRVYNGKRVKVWVGNPSISQEKAFKRLKTLLKEVVENKAKKDSALGRCK
jgi:hypothetical protein